MTTRRSHRSGWLAWLAVLCLVATAPAQAALRVFACEPEWAALTRELAGPQAEVYTATQALQDPHQVQARPSLIAAVRRADLVVCTGAELEAGWLPLLLRQSGNARVQEGAPGYLEAASAVTMLDVPTQLDRAQGDVHAAGNPHIQTAPATFAAVAPVLARRLAALDAAHAPLYQQRLADFQQRWAQASARWARQAAPLKGVRIAVQHQGFVYLERWLGLEQVVALEPKPGVEPSSAHLAQVLKVVQERSVRPVRMVLRAAYSDGRGSQWLAERAGIPVVVLPFTVGGSDQAQDLFSLFDDTLARLLKALP